MYQHLYQLFLKANPHQLHMASHSHHYWPDCTLQAHIDYWQDSAKLTDKKWEHFFSIKIPETSSAIKKIISASQTHEIVYAPNTHELITRLLSSFDKNETCHVLTSDSEFYSFQRQLSRLSESNDFTASYVSTEPFHNFTERFTQCIQEQMPKIVFISRVFFNSGFICEINKMIDTCQKLNIILVIDDYHGFMAIPINLSNLSDTTFYLAGSYKYAQGGEGCCFMLVPKNSKLRPRDTGWFAQIGGLANLKIGEKVSYPENEFRFAGSTMDFSGLYRLNAVFKEFNKNNITVNQIHSFIQTQQKTFLDELDQCSHPVINKQNLVVKDLNQCGHFLTFECKSVETAVNLQKEFEQRGLIVDGRGSRLRFGFGLYQPECFNLNKYL